MNTVFGMFPCDGIRCIIGLSFCYALSMCVNMHEQRCLPGLDTIAFAKSSLHPAHPNELHRHTLTLYSRPGGQPGHIDFRVDQTRSTPCAVVRYMQLFAAGTKKVRPSLCYSSSLLDVSIDISFKVVALQSVCFRKIKCKVSEIYYGPF